MRRIFILILLACLCLPLSAKRVYTFMLDSEIDAAAWRHTQRAIEQMEQSVAPFDLMLLELNTYGGAVDMADSIRTALLRVDIPTVAFVNHNAASAGALIALACDTIYMSPAASMGAATVVNQNGEPMPPKYQNYWSSIMRATAMSHGKYVAEGDSVERWRRNPDIAADMVTPEKAVAFTAEEAIAQGIADGVASSRSDLLGQIGYTQAQITAYEPSMSDNILGFLASAGVRAVLIMLIVGGIYMEMHTPGMGFAAAVASVAAILYFMPMVVTGSLAPWVIILFIAGIVLMALEIFVIPGFGVAGICGIIAIAASLVGAMLDYSAIEGIDMSGLGQACLTLLSGIVLSVLLIWLLLSKHGPKCFKKSGGLTLEQNLGDDYIGVDTSLVELIGTNGVAITDLRPAGKVEIDGKRYDATSTGDYIPTGTNIKVVKYEAAQLYIEQKSTEE